MKNQSCVADAFLERFGAALGCQIVDFGSQNLEHIIVDAERHRRTPGHRPLEARRWEARNRQASATSAENNALVIGAGETDEGKK